MQDKHVVIFCGREDRDVFINKIDIPYTVYHISDIGGKPEKGDIIVGNQQCYDWILAQYIVDNYDNLHEYTIFTQADPRDHAEYLELAIKSTFTDEYGSFCYARSVYEQYTLTWERLHAVSLSAKRLGIDFDNSLNKRKFIYFCEAGNIFYVHKNRILQKPKSFYQSIIDKDNDDEFYDYVINYNHPQWLYQEINKLHPQLRNLSNKDKIAALTINLTKDQLAKNSKNRQDYLPVSFEPIWRHIFLDDDFFKQLNKAQSLIGNQLSFSSNFDVSPEINTYPFSQNPGQTIYNFRMMENNWFDWNCPHYLKWREKLIEKTLWEGQQRGFNGQDLLDYYERIGYKHISF